jgi:hypothetical protein
VSMRNATGRPVIAMRFMVFDVSVAVSPAPGVVSYGVTA